MSFAVSSVILITPTALVIIYTKYRPGEWHSTIFLTMHIHVEQHHFVQCEIGFYIIYLSLYSTLFSDNFISLKILFGIVYEIENFT